MVTGPKAESATLVIFGPRINFNDPVHFSKTMSPIVRTESGSEISLNAVPENEKFPISSTKPPMYTVVNDVQL
jgi:hypothetical protein